MARPLELAAARGEPREVSPRPWIAVLALHAAANLLAGSGCDRDPATKPASLASPPAAPAPREVRVLRAIDGDSALLAGGRELRYLGLDAPEVDMPGFEAARSANRGLVEGKLAVVESSPAAPADAFGRLLGTVYVAGGDGRRLCVSVELVRSGWAWVYQKDPESVPRELLKRLKEAQDQALRHRRGVWTRLDAAAARAGALMSTRLRLHRTDCPHLRNARPRPVQNLESELRAGKSPCRSCRPLW